MIQILNYLLIIFACVYVILVLWMRRGWFLLSEPNNTVRPTMTVSVIIAARNEELNIRRTIESILGQNYPRELLELIIIDDHSDDSTSLIVKEYEEKGVKLIQLNENGRLNSYKKLAISRAIDCCHGEIIITTDADCRMGSNWLKTVISSFEKEGAYLQSSPVVYSEEKSFFERLQTLEFLYLIGLGAAGIGNKKPTTCNGANLAYRKDIFKQMGGFKGIDELASGDDELFLHKVAEQYPDRIIFCKSQDAVVYTDAKPDLKSFISQRRRWASKSTKYKNKGVIALGISIWFFNLLILVAAVLALCGVKFVAWVVLFALLLKMTVEFLFIQPLTRFASRNELLWYLPLLSLAHILYLAYIGILGNVGKYDWKGRQVK
ncbi:MULTISPECIES: glycosyltransferase family 2 protein [Sphingobacterium]|uniref:N-glycosyltransferase n=5 Tax=Sphingobacteriaceae TaxID=84566 RepID=A0A654BQA0_SPHMU|nr:MULTISPECIES: glycosyltransferase [Sphingobacterium]OJZ03403.1 MAG: glycosyl transferase [Sphingobacterium sp. 40-24]SUJ07311.1 N-glycosyltransferase [Sphingobacterium multivorum]VXC82778.1 N-glycosyltransferase [Sphingobacterium multivorum]